MPQIIVKSRTPANIHGKPDGAGAATGPIVIDFREHRKGIPASFLLAALAIFCSFFFSALVAIVLITEKSNDAARHMAAPAPLSIEDVPASFSLEPLPTRTLIQGRDFQRSRSVPAQKLTEKELVPLLEKLPLNSLAPLPQRRALAIDVMETPQKNPATLAREADRAYAAGDMAGALKAANAALSMAPDDAALRQNLTALLLENAQVHEEAENWAEAAKAYDRALKAIKGQSSLKASITARRDFVRTKAE